MKITDHIEGFKIIKLTESEELGKTIEVRNIELKLLNNLLEINRLLRRGKANEQAVLDKNIDFIGVEILRLHISAWDPDLHSGTNGEVLSRLVGEGILADFPAINFAEKTKQQYEHETEVRYQHEFAKGKAKLGISVITEMNIDGLSVPVKMDCMINLSKKQLQVKANEVENEIAKFEEVRDKLRI